MQSVQTVCGLTQRIHVEDYARAETAASAMLAATQRQHEGQLLRSMYSDETAAATTAVMVPSHPGAMLCTHHALMGMRVTTVAGCVVTTLLHVRRLRRQPPRSRVTRATYAAAAARSSSPILPLRLWASLTYTTPLGCVGGALYGVWHESRAMRPDVLAAQLSRERASAAAAARLAQRQLQTMEQRMRDARGRLERVLVACGLCEDVVAARMRAVRARLGSNDASMTPFGLLWMHTHSTVHSARWYRHRDDDNDKDEADATSTTSAGTASAGTTSATTPSPPPSRVYLSKVQTDYLVGRVLHLQCNATERRWTQTALCAMLASALAAVLRDSGSRSQRLGRGLGAGVMLASLVSLTRIDTLTTAVSSSLRADVPCAPLVDVFAAQTAADDGATTTMAAAEARDDKDSRLRVYVNYAAPLAAVPALHHDNNNNNHDDGVLVTPSSYVVLDERKLQQLLCDALGRPHSTTHCHDDGNNNNNKESNSIVCTEAAATAAAVADDATLPLLPRTHAGAHDAGDYYTRLLRHARATTAAALQPRHDAAVAAEARVRRVYVPALRYAVLALLTLHLTVYVHWIFVVFDWGVVEPTTFFVSYTAVYASIVYHAARRGADALGWPSLLTYLATRRTRTLLKRQRRQQQRRQHGRCQCDGDAVTASSDGDDDVIARTARLRHRLRALDAELRRHESV